MKTPFTRQLLKPLFFLAVLTIICAFFARTLTDSETLTDYAAKRETEQNASTSQNEENQDYSVPQNETIKNEPASQNREAHNDSVPQNETTYEKTEPHINKEKTVSDQEDASMTSDDDTNLSAERTIYKEGFYYEQLTDEVKEIITGISYPVSAADAAASALPAVNLLADDASPAVSYDDLRYLSVLYYDFNGEVQTGELICNKGIAQDLVEIFYELYRNEYQIEKIKLIDEYQGDDTASMADNNTSCFNYRVVDGTTSLSKHALGCAIDINPFYNPYVVYNHGADGETYISPAGSEIYADRSREFPYKIDENDLCCRLFKEHGFIWGGNWNSCKDYQHFQKVPE